MANAMESEIMTQDATTHPTLAGVLWRSGDKFALLRNAILAIAGTALLALSAKIQVPGGTEPIVLHRDAVSGGGYFMLGTVISADMDLIGQLQPHTPTKFVSVDMKQALAARHERKALLQKVRQSLA